MNNTWHLTNGANVSVTQTADRPSKYLIYFHGGGLVYGTKADMPQALQKIFLDQGYAVLAVDYLLAPNSSLAAILADLEKTFTEIHKKIADADFVFCGRSAGAYLMLLLTEKLIAKKQKLPKQLVSFYGYTDLKFVETPRAIFPTKIPEESLRAIETVKPVYDDPNLRRVLLYIYGIQHNLLLDYYQASATDFQLAAATFSQLPPVFTSASTNDLEVPFHYSKQLAKQVSASQFVPVYDLEHDFLKDTDNSQVQKVFQQLTDWLF
ncbi:alpha/beta hydrolase [Enterococcus sp. LJL120]